VIAAGVLAGGIAVGGMTVAQAAGVVQQQAAPLVLRRVTVAVGRRRYSLGMRRIGMRLDALRTAKRAYYAGRDRGPNVEVALALRWSARKVAAFVARVDRKASIAPRNATVRITVTKIFKRRAKSGRAVDEKALRASIDAVLADPRPSRLLRIGRAVVPARVTAKNLAGRYPTVLTIDRGSYALRLFKRLKLVKRYPIAVGAAGYDTPPGLYSIQNKQVNPAWHAPNQPWAGALAGTVIPGGAPNNPLKARWLGIVSGVGIHGTAEPWSIGTRASHGCIRMHVGDVIDLYPRVPIGSPVLIR
jgi:lipoprotein-anchoring transpeptidase ErfK/SrfK